MRLLSLLIIFTCFMFGGCKKSAEGELQRLGILKLPETNELTFRANYCAPENVALNTNSLLIFVMDNSGSNNYRSIDGVNYIGTDSIFIPDKNSKYASLKKEESNIRYEKLKEIIETQTANHSYALVTFSDDAETIKVDDKIILTKEEIINKIVDMREKEVEIHPGENVESNPDKTNKLSKGGTNYINSIGSINQSLISTYLESLGLTGNDFAYISVYFFSDGAPIVGNNKIQDPADINQAIGSFMQTDTYTVEGHEVNVHKSFNTIYYSFPLIEVEWKYPKYVPKLETSDGVKCFAVNETCDYVIAQEEGESLADLKKRLQDMANTWGRGSFHDLEKNLDFESIGIGSRVEKYSSFHPFVLNVEAKWTFDEGKQVAVYKKDSDGDGLTDEDEQRLGCDPSVMDSNQNGIRDGIEGECRSENLKDFCQEHDKHDNDQDGLTLCEEKFLLGKDASESHTESGPDENNNLVPDYLEAYIGLSLQTDQTRLDFDNDGISNLDEILLNTPVFYHNEKFTRDLKPQKYELTPLIVSQNNNQCFDLSVSHFLTTFNERNPKIKMWFRNQSFFGKDDFSELKESKRAKDQIINDDFRIIGGTQ